MHWAIFMAFSLMLPLCLNEVIRNIHILTRKSLSKWIHQIERTHLALWANWNSCWSLDASTGKEVSSQQWYIAEQPIKLFLFDFSLVFWFSFNLNQCYHENSWSIQSWMWTEKHQAEGLRDEICLIVWLCFFTVTLFFFYWKHNIPRYQQLLWSYYVFTTERNYG